MGDMNFPESPAVDDGYLDWSWDGEKWVHNGLTGLESKPANITTADVKLTNPQRSDFETQEDANQYFYDSIQNGGGGGDGSVDLSNYYTKPQADDKFQLKGNYLTDFTEQDPTVPQHVKSITTSDINKWNNPPTGGGGGGAVDSVNGKTGTVVLNYTDVGAQQAGSYAASNHNHSGVYAPASHTHNYAAVGASYTKSESDGKYALKGSGGSDPNAVKLTGDQTVSGNKTFLGLTKWTNMFLDSSVPAGGVGISGKARIEFAPNATTIYSGANTLQVNANGTALTGNLEVNNGGLRGVSFNTHLSGSPTTSVASFFGRTIFANGANGAGFYFSNGNSITPTNGSGAEIDSAISLGNPSYMFSYVWSYGGVVGIGRHYQNGDEAVLSVNELVDVLKDLRDSTQSQSTFEGLRESMTGCLDQLVGRLEGIQLDAKNHLDDVRKKAEEDEDKEQEYLDSLPTDFMNKDI